ncbi:MAG: hypothetical protein CM15mP71_0060 [Candidatus Poseidoniales archaeon]|nr:MAG: hypothetical protein CM15mP71_0060 [Candidatus Poseidoniales archaeon]
MGAMTWVNGPSNTFRLLTTGVGFFTRAQTHTSSPSCNREHVYRGSPLRCGSFPKQGEGVIGTGDHDLFIFDDVPVTHNMSNGMHDLKTRFRTSQTFDDQSELRFEVRIGVAWHDVSTMPRFVSGQTPRWIII